nr:hypothetical protein [Tanacetum cinerariifolium]
MSMLTTFITPELAFIYASTTSTFSIATFVFGEVKCSHRQYKFPLPVKVVATARRLEMPLPEQYVLLPLWSTGSKDPQNTDADAAFADKTNESEVHVSPSSSDKKKKHDEKAKREAKRKSHVDISTGVRDLSDDFEEFFVNSTNGVNAASAPVTAVGP